MVVALGAVEPDGQYVPGEAVQAPEQVGVERPLVFPNVPEGQLMHEAMDEAPKMGLNVPAGQAVALREERGQ